MRKLIIACLTAFLLCTATASAESTVQYVSDTVTVGAGATKLLEEVQFEKPLEGIAAFKWTLTGDGTATITYKVTFVPNPSASDWITPSTFSNLATGFVKTSGDSGSDAVTINFHEMPVFGVRIYGTETGGANNFTVTTSLVYF